MLNTIVAELDRTELENQGVNLSVALTKIGISLVGLPGNVATPYTANSMISSSGSAGSTSGGLLPFGGQLIPLLLSPNLTYGLSAQNSNIAWNGFFQFLEAHSLGKVLAEPHLLANSGEKAKFLSGGEIPIVIAQALNSTIVFKTFGTSVEFIPTVVGRDDIELLVKTEVSEPDYTHGVMLFGFTVPAFVTRRAETMARLKDRQTLIIAGLILHRKSLSSAEGALPGRHPLRSRSFPQYLLVEQGIRPRHERDARDSPAAAPERAGVPADRPQRINCKQKSRPKGSNRRMRPGPAFRPRCAGE